MRSRTLIAAAAAGLAAFSAAGEAAPAQLNAHAIAALFPGYFEAKFQGYNVQFSGSSDGFVKGQAYGQQDQGRWYVQGNKLCVAWKQWTKGEAKCGTISRKDGWFVAIAGTGETLTFRRVMIAQQ